MVDRSYHKFEAVRMYTDRRIMKWNPFATAELGAAMRDYRASLNQREKLSVLEKEEIQTILHWGMLQNLEMALELKQGYESVILQGKVITWQGEEQILFYTSDGHYTEIDVADIIYLCPATYIPEL